MKGLASSAVRRWLLAGFAGLAGLAILHVWTPSHDPSHAICFTRRLLHFPCPGCGMTRAFAHLAKFEWAAAWKDHPLSFMVAPEIILGWAVWGAALVYGQRFRLPVRVETVLLANAGALFALWLGRMATGTLPW